MNDISTICYRTKPGFIDDFVARLSKSCERWLPVTGSDNICRLQQTDQIPGQPPVGLPCIPLKKILLPDRDQVWSWDSRSFQPPAAMPPRVVFGVAYCDLQALWYLDQVFGEDPLYLSRRARLLVVGAICHPSAGCRCQPDQMPVAGDIFWSGDRVWGLSEQGRLLLAGLGPLLDGHCDDPLPEPEGVPRGQIQCDEALFRKSADLPVWQEQGRRCLSCGACSAVCPTCYCYDMIDRVAPDGDVTRHRVWDNCFFPDHAEVAGGHDFRPDRAIRLRFRFEHKKLGFGPLRGKASCVGCGRCQTVCPVGIELERIAEQVVGAAAS